MLTANVLNSNATLNSFQVQSSIQFINGFTLTLNFQIYDTTEQLRYVPPATAVVTMIFNRADGTTLSKVATLNTSDRSMGTINFSAADTQQLIGGNALLSVDLLGDGTQVMQGLVLNALQKVTIDT